MSERTPLIQEESGEAWTAAHEREGPPLQSLRTRFNPRRAMRDSSEGNPEARRTSESGRGGSASEDQLEQRQRRAATKGT
eukprot:415840-Prorocentrum_lima.AAC.1